MQGLHCAMLNAAATDTSLAYGVQSVNAPVMSCHVTHRSGHHTNHQTALASCMARNVCTSLLISKF